MGDLGLTHVRKPSYGYHTLDYLLEFSIEQLVGVVKRGNL